MAKKPWQSEAARKAWKKRYLNKKWVVRYRYGSPPFPSSAVVEARTKAIARERVLHKLRFFKNVKILSIEER